MRRIVVSSLALMTFALAACESPKAPAPDTHARAVTLPAPPPATIYDAEISQRMAREWNASPDVAGKFSAFWDYAVVSKTLSDLGILVSPEDIELAKKQWEEMRAARASIRFTSGSGLSYVPASADSSDLDYVDEQHWFASAAAGMRKLSDIAETLEPGTITATAEEISEAKKIAFGETVSIYDFICTEKLETTKIIAELKSGVSPAQVAAKKRTMQPLSVSKLDKRIAEDFQAEIWTTLKAAPGAFSSEGKFDKRYGAWHVIYIKSVNPAREPSRDELAAMTAQIGEAKRAAWMGEHLRKLKIASIPSVRISDPELRKAFELSKGVMKLEK